MIVLAALPLLLSVVMWRAAPTLAARCTPSWAVRSLVVLSLATAAATGLVLCSIACLAFAEIPAVGRLGHWSATALARRAPIPPALGLAAGVVAAVLVAMSAMHLARALVRIADAGRTCRALGPGVDGLVIVHDQRATAYAVPGWRGRTVVSSALLRALDPDERRAVLAHEQAHLRHRHFAYVQLAELAAAANPLLRPAAAQVRRAVEAWADDDAVREVGDRVPVARALAKAALAAGVAAADTAQGVRVGGVAVALGVTGTSDVAHRVRNLLEPTPRRSGRWVALMAAVTIVGSASALTVGGYAHANFETAQWSYTAQSR